MFYPTLLTKTDKLHLHGNKICNGLGDLSRTLKKGFLSAQKPPLHTNSSRAKQIVLSGKP